MSNDNPKTQETAGDRPAATGSALLTPRTNFALLRAGRIGNEFLAFVRRLEIELSELRAKYDNHIDVCRHCSRTLMGGTDDLLRRWLEWATSHGHDIGILDDTREYLRPIRSVPNVAGKARVGKCPLEQRIAKALDAAGIEYRTDYEGGVPEALDFFLPKFGVHIEIKGGHSERISGQMVRSKNVIVAQGGTAVELLAAMIESLPNKEYTDQNSA